MRIKNLFMSSRYVASGIEIVLCSIMFLCLVFASVVSFSKIKEIPVFPGRLVLENACIFKEVSQSGSTSYLYLRVGLEDNTYDYVIEAFSHDIRHLDLSKSRELLVAVGSEREKQFVWGVYDSGGMLLIGRKDILEWARHYNFGLYFLVLTWSVVSLYFLLIIVWHGVWNRIVAKRTAQKNQADGK